MHDRVQLVDPVSLVGHLADFGKPRFQPQAVVERFVDRVERRPAVDADRLVP